MNWFEILFTLPLVATLYLVEHPAWLGLFGTTLGVSCVVVSWLHLRTSQEILDEANKVLDEAEQLQREMSLRKGPPT